MGERSDERTIRQAAGEVAGGAGRRAGGWRAGERRGENDPKHHFGQTCSDLDGVRMHRGLSPKNENGHETAKNGWK